MYRNAHDVDLIHEILVFGVARETELQFLKAAREAARIMKDVDPKKKWDTMQKLACGAVWGGY